MSDVLLCRAVGRRLSQIEEQTKLLLAWGQVQWQTGQAETRGMRPKPWMAPSVVGRGGKMLKFKGGR